NDLAAAFGKISAALGCEADNTQAGCGVTFRYIVQIYRDNPPDDVFVQTETAAALIRAEPRFVGLNLVGPEDYLVARRDYTRQMESSGFSRATCRWRCTRASYGSASFRPPISLSTSAKPSRSPAPAASATVSPSPLSAMRWACSERCARAPSRSRSASPATT